MESIIAQFIENPYLLFLLIVWTMPWKGVALWRAARRGERGWFIVLFLVQTVAVLDIIYIFAVSKRSRRIV